MIMSLFRRRDRSDVEPLIAVDERPAVPDSARAATVEDLARVLSAGDCAADEGHPGWDNLASMGQDEYRRLARYVMRQGWSKTTTDVAGGRGAAEQSAAAGTGVHHAPGDTIRTARQAEDVLDQLARALALTAVPDAGAYDRLPDAFRAIYQRQADAVVLARWRPPVRTLVPASRVSVVAAVLVAHEMTVEDDCRCGWRGDPLMHAEHQASQLIALGVLG